MNKKIVCLFLCLVLCIGTLSGCSKSEEMNLNDTTWEVTGVVVDGKEQTMEAYATSLHTTKDKLTTSYTFTTEAIPDTKTDKGWKKGLLKSSDVQSEVQWKENGKDQFYIYYDDDNIVNATYKQKKLTIETPTMNLVLTKR